MALSKPKYEEHKLKLNPKIHSFRTAYNGARDCKNFATLDFTIGRSFGNATKMAFLLCQQDDTDVGIYLRHFGTESEFLEKPIAVECKVTVRCIRGERELDGQQYSGRIGMKTYGMITADWKDILNSRNIFTIPNMHLLQNEKCYENGNDDVEFRFQVRAEELEGPAVQKNPVVRVRQPSNKRKRPTKTPKSKTPTKTPTTKATKDSPRATPSNQTADMTLVSDFSNLLETGENSDVTLIVVWNNEAGDKEDIEIKAHKGILSARSPVFAKMFSRITTRTLRGGGIIIMDVPPKVMQMILKFIYTGAVDSGWKLMPVDLIVAAEKYELTQLMKYVEDNIALALTPQNLKSVKRIGRTFKMKGLIEATEKLEKKTSSKSKSKRK